MMKMIIAVIVIGAVLSATPGQAKECTHLSGSPVYKCYHAITLPMKFFRAIAICRSQFDGEVASPLTWDQLDVVKSVARKNGEGTYWLGASCAGYCEAGYRGGWHWTTTYKRVMDNWEPPEPNYVDEDEMFLVLTANLKFDDRSFWTLHWAICEYCTDDPEKAKDKNCIKV